MGLAWEGQAWKGAWARQWKTGDSSTGASHSAQEHWGTVGQAWSERMMACTGSAGPQGGCRVVGAWGGLGRGVGGC